MLFHRRYFAFLKGGVSVAFPTTLMSQNIYVTKHHEIMIHFHKIYIYILLYFCTETSLQMPRMETMD